MYSLPLEPLLQCSPFIRKQSPQSLSWATAIQQRSPLPLWRCRLPFSLSFFSLSAQQAESVCSAKPVHSTRCLLINKLEFKSAAKSFTTSSHKSGGMQWQKIYHFSEMTINYFDCHNIKGQHQTESKVLKKKNNSIRMCKILSLQWHNAYLSPDAHAELIRNRYFVTVPGGTSTPRRYTFWRQRF